MRVWLCVVARYVSGFWLLAKVYSVSYGDSKCGQQMCSADIAKQIVRNSDFQTSSLTD